MTECKDEQTGNLIHWEAPFDEVVGQTVTLIEWVVLYSDKYKGQRVYLYCITSKKANLVVTTYSSYVLMWCLLHRSRLPLEVKFTKKDNKHLIQAVEGGKSGASDNKETATS